jgi:TRAP transporter TAXI family solute receptor
VFRRCIIVFALAFGLLSCRPSITRARPNLRFWSATAASFTQGLVARYGSLASVSVQHAESAPFVVSALAEDRGDIGIAIADAVYVAYRHSERDPRARTNLRGIAVLWVNALYVLVRRDSAIYDVADLKHKRIGVMVRSSSSELLARDLLRSYHIEYSDISPTFQMVDESAKQIKTGGLDGLIFTGPREAIDTSPILADLNRSMGFRLLSINQSAIDRLRAEDPFLRPILLANIGQTHQKNVETVGADALLICQKNLDEELVYELTKALFEGLPQLQASIAEAAAIDPDGASATPIPLHPGAARYYREREILR